MNKLLNSLLIWLLLLTPAFAFADTAPEDEQNGDEIVNFDDMEEDEIADFSEEEENEEEPASPAARFVDALKFNLYIDLGLSAKYYARRSTDKMELTFDQNHRNFLVRAQYKDFLTVHLDLANSFNQVTIQLFPDNFIFFGKILVPFGNIDYHPLYGGRVDENGVFLPTTWSNLGAGYRALLAGRRGNLALYMLNGFSLQGTPLQPTFSVMENTDQNPLKAIGVRYEHQITSGFSLTASVLADFPSAENSWNDHILLYGLDTVLKIKAFTFSAGITAQEVYLESLGDTTRLLLPASYLRMGSYAEFKYDFSKKTAMRLRFGHLDPNMSIETATDQINGNIALILNLGVIQLTTEYNLMMHMFPDPAYESENYQNSLKINALIQL